MPLKLTGEHTSTIVEHYGAALPAGVPVPSNREAIEALGLISSLVKRNATAVVDGELVPLSAALDVIRRFILTR